MKAIKVINAKNIVTTEPEDLTNSVILAYELATLGGMVLVCSSVKFVNTETILKVMSLKLYEKNVR